MTTECIPIRVARGAAWLDTVRPGWRDSITPSALVMSEGCSCICGQVFAEACADDGFSYALETYADDQHWDIRHGFSNRCLPNGSVERWADLEAEWLRVIGIGAPKPERVTA